MLAWADLRFGVFGVVTHWLFLRRHGRTAAAQPKPNHVPARTSIVGGVEFREAAGQHSSCPSSAQGGELGSFGPGQMVPEFDEVIWKELVGEVHGPVKTSFGYHLSEIVSREE
ncbi:MAG: peptidylprolyl isomerase [Acidobacteria bacterium]|nr:peptidylprolyl isomerase [Acidobacteriota bacterium]